MLELRPVGRMFCDGHRWEMPEGSFAWSADDDGRPVVWVTVNLFDDAGHAVTPVVDDLLLSRLTVDDVAEMRAALAPHTGRTMAVRR